MCTGRAVFIGNFGLCDENPFVWICGICQALWDGSVVAPQMCSGTLCVKGPLLCAGVSREVVFGVPEDFPELLSACLLS